MNKKIISRIFAWAVLALVALSVYGFARGHIGRFIRDQNMSYPQFVDTAYDFLVAAGHSLHERAEITRENVELSEQNAELQARMLRFEELERENADLRVALGLSTRHVRSVSAEVISRDGVASGWLKTVRINKGERDGVRKNAPVINEKGLVGRVFETSRRTSDVLLLADPNSSVSCYVERIGESAHGVLTGDGFAAGGGDLLFTGVVKPLTFDYLDKDIEIRVGDRILTSGLGGVFSKGLAVGVVTEIGTTKSKLYQTAVIAPYADLKTTSLVFVLSTEADDGADVK